MNAHSNETSYNSPADVIPGDRARQGITGVHVRRVLAASTVGAVIAIGVVYAIAV